jgi:hypothetical protein
MRRRAHLGVEYNDLGPRIAVVADGDVHSIQTLSDEPVWPTQSGPPFGITFTGLYRLIDQPDVQAALRNVFESVRKIADGRLVIAVPTGLMSLRRSLLMSSAQAAGFAEVELIDASIPSGLIYASGSAAPTTQLVYYLGYGECEYTLLRVVRGRVKVLGSGLAPAVSGQQFELQLMEAIVRALQEKNVFLGLSGFRTKDWLEFRRIAAEARKELAKKPAAEVTFPSALVRDGGAVRVTVSAMGLATRLAPAIRTTIEDAKGLLEEHDIKPNEVDAVVALGDTATRYPVTALLEQAFPGKLMISDAGLIAAGAAAYSAWLDRNPADTAPGPDMSYYLTPYQPHPDLLVPEEVGPPVVSAIAVDQAIGFGPESKTIPTAASTDAPGRSGAEPAGGRTVTVAAAKEVSERLRSQIEEATQLLQRLDPEKNAPPVVERPTGESGAQILMDQAEDMLTRGLYLEAVSLAHRAHEEARRDGAIFSRMMRVHVNASLALDQPEQYVDSIQLLMCAHSHDRTDPAVRRALATRHLRHAGAMRGCDEKAALAAVQKALRFDPKHDEALTLLEELRGVPPPKAE